MIRKPVAKRLVTVRKETAELVLLSVYTLLLLLKRAYWKREGVVRWFPDVSWAVEFSAQSIDSNEPAKGKE